MVATPIPARNISAARPRLPGEIFMTPSSHVIYFVPDPIASVLQESEALQLFSDRLDMRGLAALEAVPIRIDLGATD